MIHKKNLIKCNWQYSVIHTNANSFKIWDKVFLKSNPEFPMTVSNINENSITTFWYTKSNKLQTHEFKPECILQYKFAALVNYNNKIYLNLN